MKVLRFLHAVLTALVFTIFFLVFLPIFMIPVLWKSQHQLVGILNRVWAHLFFTFSLFPYKVEYRFTPEKGQRYIFCPNHFSYLDIPTMGLNKVNSIFVGKHDMEKIPLFGYMYKKLHITVDRESLKSRYSTLLQSGQALDDGKSLVIFPEGGIVTKDLPNMARFKDGAFRLAIEKQIPVIPVTIAYNWIILPDSTLLPRRHKMKVIFHEPIHVEKYTMADLQTLKQLTFEVIDQELKRHSDENR